MMIDVEGRRAKLRRLRNGGRPRVLELCSGCGGLSLGLSAAGFDLVAHIEADETAARSYALNFGRAVEGFRDAWAEPRDMTTSDPASLARDIGLQDEVAEQFDVLAAGLPCQAFARIGRSKLRSVTGDEDAFKNDPRAKLYRRFLQFVEATQPAAILIENVPDIFRATEKLVSSQPWYNGGYRANIVAYTLAVLSEITRRHGSSIDFQRVWNVQAINSTLQQTLTVISDAVNAEIIRPPTGISNISEWCKRDACWTGLLAELPNFEKLLPDEFWGELLTAEDSASEAKTARKIQKMDNGIEAQRRVIGIAAAEWARVHKVLAAKQLLSSKEVGVLDIAMQMPAKIPTEKQCVVLLETIEKARLEGISI